MADAPEPRQNSPLPARPAALPREAKTPVRRSLSRPSLSHSAPAKNSQTVKKTPINSRRPPETRQLTPHGAHAFQQLRAAKQTPGKNRRHSARLQRETPRGILRALSRALAPVSQPIQSSPRSAPQSSKLSRPLEEDVEGDYEFPQPRLSVYIGGENQENDELAGDDNVPQPQLTPGVGDEEADNSFEYPPPRMSVPLEDDDDIQMSIELPRRAISEQPMARYSRASFGSIRLSEYFDEGETSRFYKGSEIPPFEDIQELEAQDDNPIMGDESRFDIGGDIDDSILEQSMARADQTARLHPELQLDVNEDTFQLDANTSRPSLIFDEGPQVEVDSDPEDEEPQIEVDSDPEDEGASLADRGSSSYLPESPKQGAVRRKPTKIQKISRSGKRLPSIPSVTMRKLATKFARSAGQTRSKLNRDCMRAIEQATDWFFEQLGDDLKSYSEHAGRKTIDETDVVALMRRQRQLKSSVTLFSLGQKHLPKELLQEIRMPRPP